jgi:hypothetical protein
MLLRLIAWVALLTAGVAVFMAFTTGQPMIFGPAAVQGVVAFAVLMALAKIVDSLETIAANSKK